LSIIAEVAINAEDMKMLLIIMKKEVAEVIS
jgi:hypothetical protein